MKNQTEPNKAIVRVFNEEFIQKGRMEIFDDIIDPEITNHVAVPGSRAGAEGMRYFLSEVLRKGFPDLKVIIQDQIAEGDKVVTRKKFIGTHLDNFAGISATGIKVSIEVIDIIRLENGRYREHWASSNLAEVLQLLKAAYENQQV